ncbi:MAG: hypothetical protein ABIN80_04495 [Dyadobacter sp.]|uniref:hypothetical protein n=1 Tax=Dyadobacter sp. TaxID=1914288 RepID=UPI00326495E3
MKIRYHVQRHLRLISGLTGFAVFIFLLAFVAADHSKGKLVYKGPKKTFNVDLQFARFVIGPDAFDDKKKIRRLIFTGTNIDEKIKSCDAMNCVDVHIEGLQVDLDAAPRLLYWVSLNGQLVQYSGTAVTETLSLTTDSQERLAGTLKFDQSAAGGPTVEVTFDAPLLKTFAKAR